MDVPESFEVVRRFICPESFWRTQGYRGEARTIAVWGTAADRVAWHDGQLQAVAEGVPVQGFRLLLQANLPDGHWAYEACGGAGRKATHCLVIDREGGLAYMTPLPEATAFVIENHPRRAPRPGQSLDALFEWMRDLGRWQEQLRTDAERAGAAIPGSLIQLERDLLMSGAWHLLGRMKVEYKREENDAAAAH